jgi:hypothetical protein
VYTSILGSFFTLFHMLTIMMQTIMVIKLFYWIPSKQGFFARDINNNESLAPFENMIPIEIANDDNY